MSIENINRIAYFGDSQTDGGNLFELTSRLFTRPFPLEEFGYTENVTNGQNYAEVATDLLGVELFNLGFGGASALGRSPLSEAIDPALTDQFLIANPDPADLAFDSSFSGQVERYLAAVAGGAPDTLSPDFEVTAWADAPDGGREIMGIRHKQHTIEGLQFHPESFLTENGPEMLRRFVEMK